jgi:hypothetical protein
MLSRWSRLKSAAKNPPAAPISTPSPEIDPLVVQDRGALADAPQSKPTDEPAQIELPNIADLTPESDFKPFMQSGVEAADRNAALKKLFTDPHYNQMDGLDIYIDDYGKPDPIPAEMLKRLMASKFLGLFEEQAPPAVAEKPTLGESESPRENPNSLVSSDTQADFEPKPEDFLEKKESNLVQEIKTSS